MGDITLQFWTKEAELYSELYPKNDTNGRPLCMAMRPTTILPYNESLGREGMSRHYASITAILPIGMTVLAGIYQRPSPPERPDIILGPIDFSGLPSKYVKGQDAVLHRIPRVQRLRRATGEARSIRGRIDARLDIRKMARLIGALKSGNTIINACRWAGISDPTFYRWKKEAKDAAEGSAAWDLWGAVKKAMAIAEDRAVRKIMRAGKKDWKACAWLLERRNPQVWGKPTWRKPKPKATTTPLRTQLRIGLPSSVQDLRK